MSGRLFGCQLWTWRNGYVWERGVTIRRNRKGFCVGVQWPPVQRCSWRPDW